MKFRFVQHVIVFCILFLSACSAKKTKVDPPLKNTYWKLVQVGEKAINTSKNQKEKHFIIDSENCLKGFLGCNSLEGTAKIENKSLVFEIDPPKRLCPEMTDELLFKNVLTSCDSYMINGQRLLLYAKGTYLASFEAVK